MPLWPGRLHFVLPFPPLGCQPCSPTTKISHSQSSGVDAMWRRIHTLASRERSAGPDRARPAGGAGEPSMCAIVKRGHCSCPSVLGRVRHFTLVASTGLQPILGTRRPPVPCTCARIEFGRAAKGCGGPALRPAGWW